jgi:hypothetical protein
MTFTQVITLLHRQLGRRVEVVLGDAGNMVVSGIFSGILLKAEELGPEEAGSADAITFLLEGSDDIASFTLGSQGFKGATVEEYGLDVRILNLRFFISLPNGAEPYPSEGADSWEDTPTRGGRR